MQAERGAQRGPAKPRVACALDKHMRGFPTACAYIRVILPLSDPMVRRRFDVEFLQADQVDQLDADIYIIQRLAFATEASIDRLLRRRQASNARLVYEIDDDLLAIDRDHSEFEYYARMGVHIRRLVSEADEVWVSTDRLAEKFRALNRSVITIQNELDRRLWPTPKASPPSPAVRLLYMGSTTHSEDFRQLLMPALERLLRERGDDLNFTLIGVSDGAGLGKGMTVLPVPPGIGINYPAFAGWLGSLPPFDIGLAPLLPTEFNQSKSHIKWLEYAAMGLVTVASNIAEYRASIVHGQSGILAECDPASMYEALRELVLDPSSRFALASAAALIADRQMAAPRAAAQRLERLLHLLDTGSTTLAGLDR